MNYPLYLATLDNLDDGIFSLSLVSEPATEFQMLCFNKQKFEYSVENQEEHIIKFPIMVADTPIYRNYLNYEFYITYSREVLKSMAQRFLSESNQNNYDIEHNGVLLPKGSIEMIEIFQKDVANGIDPKGFESVSDGSLLATCRVCDETLWEMCKSGDFSGISLTGFFSLIELEQFSKMQKKQNFNMTLNNLKNLIKDILLNYNSQESSVGNLFYNGDEIMQGTALTDKDGNPIADGEVLIDGYKLIIENGMVKEMNPIEEEAPSTEDKPTVEEPITEEVKEDEPKEEETPSEEVETPIEEQPTEETPIEEPTDEPTEDVTPLVEEPQPNADIEALKTEVESLKAAISDLLKKISTPAEKPIIEEFSAVSENEKNIPSNIKKLMGYAKYLK